MTFPREYTVEVVHNAHMDIDNIIHLFQRLRTSIEMEIRFSHESIWENVLQCISVFNSMIAYIFDNEVNWINVFSFFFGSINVQLNWVSVKRRINTRNTIRLYIVLSQETNLYKWQKHLFSYWLYVMQPNISTDFNAVQIKKNLT
jgi:hypothetical protein